ncbi:MAG: alkaline phosphatase family protein [Caulobacteraceae bacterium]
MQHQILDVLTQLCGQTAAQKAVDASGHLIGGVYPQVTNAGFAADYATKSDKDNPGEPMRGFKSGTLPVLTALANEFVLCDHWFSAMAGPTEPNRMFAHAATSGGWDDSPTNGDYEEIFGAKSVGDASAGISFANGTIFDALRRAKVPFRIYTGTASRRSACSPGSASTTTSKTSRTSLATSPTRGTTPPIRSLSPGTTRFPRTWAFVREQLAAPRQWRGDRRSPDQICLRGDPEFPDLEPEYADHHLG